MGLDGAGDNAPIVVIQPVLLTSLKKSFAYNI
jgi:hypothetical protein